MSNATNIICLSGSREKLQMAAMVASVSVACGDQVTVFFSMNALEYFVKGRDHAAPIEGEFGKLLDKKGVPAFKTLFQQAVDLGDAKLLPCSMAMDLLEITEKHRLRREEAARLLHEIADSLARHNGLDLQREGKKIRVNVPDRVALEVEVEIDSDESSIEIEITW